MRKALILARLALLVVKLLWPWLGQLSLGRLPGDLGVERERFRV